MSKDPADKLSAPSFFKKKKPEPGRTVAPQDERRFQPAGRTAPQRPVPAQRAPEPASTRPMPRAPQPPRPARPVAATKAPGAPRAPKPAKAAKAPKPPKPARERPALEIPTPSGLVSAIVVGVISGAFLALAVWGTGQLSQLVQGTSSLGKLGMPALVVIFAVTVLLGGYLLNVAKVASAYTISFLACALVAVLSMLFLLDLFDSIWGAVVVVVLTAVAYTLAHWVTTNYIDKQPED